MPLNGHTAATIRTTGLILAGALAGLTGGAYTGSEAGTTQVQRELGEHKAKIEELRSDISEVKDDVKDIQGTVHTFGSQLNRIEFLVERNTGDTQ